MKVSGSNIRHLEHWLLLGGLVIVYFIAGKLGLHFAFLHSSASAVWPPTGIALAAVLLFGYRVAPAIFVGAFLVNITTAGSATSSLGIALGNTLEAIAGGFLVMRFAGGRAAFTQARHIVQFSWLAGLLATSISATIGVTTLVLTGYAESIHFGAIWLTWWLGDAAGALIVTPVLVLWATQSLGPLAKRPTESVLLLVVVVATGALVFMHPALNTYPLPFLCIPPLIWATFRFGPREVATGVAILSAIAATATVRGLGPFVTSIENESLLLLQAFMATTAAMTLPVSALVWERKAVERERAVLLAREQAARAEAEAANHAKDEFLAMLSHELRNPLAAITNAAHVLSGFEQQHDFASCATEIVQRQTKHLSRLIDDLLDVARVTHGKIVLTRERLNLAEIVQQSLAVIGGAGRLDQHRVDLQLEPVWVNADPARLSQVVENILINAIKYTPTDGQITVETLAEGEEATLRVRDTGIGISRELLPRIFDLFIQGQSGLDRAQGGLGIGLTLVRRLVELHGGRVAAESDGPFKGTTFVVRLPRAEARRADTATIAAAASRPKRILIVEDDGDGREAMRMHLTMAGHEVHEAADGETGIEIVQRVRPDVVLLDIGLPGMNGYELARRLKSRPDCPRLVAVTGYGRSEDKERANSAGFDAHITKPVEPDELQRVLT